MQTAEDPVSRPLVWLGSIGVVFTFPTIWYLYFVSESLSELVKTLRDPPLHPMTIALILVGRAIGYFWYIPIVAILAIYLMKIRMHCRSQLWFNAIYPIILLSLIAYFSSVFASQQMMIHEVLTKK